MLDRIKKVQTSFCKKYNNSKIFFHKAYNKHIIYTYITTAILVDLLIEMIARGSFLKGIYFLIASPYIFICNAIIILMTLSFTLLLRKRVFGLALFVFIWIAFGITDGILLSNRVTPFTAVDFKLIDNAFIIMGKYFSNFQIALVVALIIVAILALIFLFIKAPKVDHKIKYGRNIMGILIIWAIGFGIINLGIGSKLIPTKFGNLRTSYYDYGFVYCFSNSVVNTGVTKPSDYSGKTINKIVKSTNKTTKVTKKPNIIFLQLESFFDLNNMKNISLSKNPVPNFENLMKNYPSGYLNVPIVGAGTVNTEFEIMTGMNLDDFGPGEYPFQTILKSQTCESICYNLKKYGYTSHAIHNNIGTFYGRNVVFSNLGYDTFTSIENMNITKFTSMGWAKDAYLTDEIVKTLKSTSNQDLIYTISVQGHGSYPTDGNYKYPIKVKGLDDESLTNQYQYYAKQTYQMDKFIGKLIKALKAIDEDTVLVMYGDHLPSLGITKNDLVNENVYQTQYVIWSNFKNGYTNEDIEAYQLEPKILSELKMTNGDINSYSQKHRKDSDQTTYLDGLHNLEYDQLYGDKLATNGTNPYTATELQFGINKVQVNSVSPMYDETGTVYVYGKYFTNYSKVYVNDESYDTTYIDGNTLMIEDSDLKTGDLITVAQQNSDENVLSKTEEYAFTAEEIKPGSKSKKILGKSSKIKEKETTTKNK